MKFLRDRPSFFCKSALTRIIYSALCLLSMISEELVLVVLSRKTEVRKSLDWLVFSPEEVKWGLCEYVIVHTILGGSPVILWISLGGKPKWLPLKFGYHDVIRTSPIGETSRKKEITDWLCASEIGLGCAD